MANNVYTVLAKKILGCANKDGGTESLPSGWTDSQPLLHLVMYNLYMKSEANRDEEEEGKEAEDWARGRGSAVLCGEHCPGPRGAALEWLRLPRPQGQESAA